MKVKHLIFCILAVLLLLSCEKLSTSVGDKTKRGEVLGSRLNVSLGVETVKKSCKHIPDSLIKYGLDCYRLEYTTLYLDELVPAEALVVIPRGTPVTKVALYCHGTNVPISMGNGGKIFCEYSGPGTGRDYQEIIDVILPLAGNGYCAIMPEYTGFCSTADRQHPFIYCPELCKCIIDALWAGREFLKSKGCTVNNDLYLCGWSQGGSAALATEKYLERDFPDKVNVKAVSTLAGPFNMVHFINSVFCNPDKYFMAIALYSWAGYAMNYFAPTMRRPGDQIYNYPIYDQVGAFIEDGSTPNELFRNYFIKGVTEKTDTVFCKVLEENSFHTGWKPKAPIFLHHGTDDMIVPCFNSVDAYEGLKDSGKIELNLYEGKGHFDFVPEYLINTLKEFNSISK